MGTAGDKRKANKKAKMNKKTLGDEDIYSENFRLSAWLEKSRTSFEKQAILRNLFNKALSGFFLISTHFPLTQFLFFIS